MVWAKYSFFGICSLKARRSLEALLHAAPQAVDAYARDLWNYPYYVHIFIYTYIHTCACVYIYTSSFIIIYIYIYK